MFSCGDDQGTYDLEVPTNENCEIELQCFAAGFAPLKVYLTPEQAADYDIIMVRPEAGSQVIEITLASEPGVVNPSWTRISGSVTSGGVDLCAMVLANGESMFSCGAAQGTFDMEVPLNDQGQIEFQCFAAGFEPYRDYFTP
jgi:hypothetical protein